MIDCEIVNALIVDGTGAPAVNGTIGIDAGQIVSIGDATNQARRTIDADGLVVAPGFIDPHTHFDAQLMWDPTASPAIFHGLTTVIAGNCGFALAPAGTNDVEFLSQMMAGTEGIPLGAIEAGLDFKWTTYADWLGRFDGALAINAGFQVGHSTLRRFVMGEDANSQRATSAQMETMKSLLHEALAAGGFGFSTSVNDHKDMRGDPVPSRSASREEMIELATVCGAHLGTSLEISPLVTEGFFSEDFIDLIASMSAAANRPINWNTIKLYGPDSESAYQRLGSSDYAKSKGGRVVCLTNPEIIRHRLSFFNPFVLTELPGCWNEILHRPEQQRIEALSDPTIRRQMKADAATDTSIGNRRSLIQWADHTFVECFTPETKAYAEGKTTGEVAAARGVDPFDALLDVVVADQLRTRFMLKARGDDEETWRLRMEIIRDPRTLIGGSDGGAHMDFQVGAALTSCFLAQAVRERQQLSLEEAVHHLSLAPAQYYGLKGRGRIAEGFSADLVMFDPDTIGPAPMEVRTDLPGDSGRMYASRTGIAAVFVNGVEVVHDGSHTGALPGTALRSGIDTTEVVAR